MKRTPLRRKTPMARSTKQLQQRKPMKKIGRRMSEWDKMRTKLKKAFGNAMIFTCELRYPGCWHSHALGFAHSLKRRNIPPGSPLLAEVCLACNHCHDIIEAIGESRMSEIVRDVIAARKEPIAI